MDLSDAADFVPAEQQHQEEEGAATGTPTTPAATAAAASAGKRKAGPELLASAAKRGRLMSGQHSLPGQPSPQIEQQKQQKQQQQQQQHQQPHHTAGLSLLKQALHKQAAQQQEHQQHQDDVPSAASRDGSPAAPAAAGREDSPGVQGAEGGSSNVHGSTEVFSVLVGDVVWVERKPNPPWPCLVISHEEASDFSVDFTRTSTPQVRAFCCYVQSLCYFCGF
jgi:hypothetical protein